MTTNNVLENLKEERKAQNS